ncbi:unnamed protein product [Peronospora belbahrii]|uniref:Uncharacterized protein n=1 Tax=Peronospora belbahrii TaxID=622444 RepID=A0AAU9KNI7_9STRA|nr:unnamed protein product [Peronospora belbahrii]CAH0519839.1 unnamed protein product [Peronospora belbahrii]
MGMACEIKSCTVTGEHEVPLIKTGDNNHLVFTHIQANEGTKIESDTCSLDPKETAMILTCLSKGYSDTSGAMTTTSGRHSDSDGEDMDGDECLSDDDDDMIQRRQFPSGIGKVHHVHQIHFDGPKGSKLDFTDDAGFSHRFRNESNRVKSLVTKHISIEELRAHFDRPIIDVAKDFGICITLMKKICRRNGIKRWPHRQIRSLSKSIASMEAAMLSAHGSERDKYRDQIMSLKMKRESVIADPNKDNSLRHRISPPPSMVGDSTHQSMCASHHVPLTLKLSPRPVHDTHVSSSKTGVPVTPIQKIENLVVSTPSTSTTGSSKGGRWTSEEHAAFLEGIRLYGKDWRRVAQVVKTRSAVQTRTHAQKYLLKFAGRSTFETDGASNGNHLLAPMQMQCAVADKPVLSMLSPASRNALSTPASDDSMTNESWNTEEGQPLAKHGEAMALILNGSPQVEPDVAGPIGNNTEATTLSPLPSRTTTSLKQSATTFHQQSTTIAAAAVPVSYSYFSPQQNAS